MIKRRIFQSYSGIWRISYNHIFFDKIISIFVTSDIPSKDYTYWMLLNMKTPILFALRRAKYMFLSFLGDIDMLSATFF